MPQMTDKCCELKCKIEVNLLMWSLLSGLVAAAIAAAWLWRRWSPSRALSSTTSQLYGLRHRVLNLPTTTPLWLNMGLWDTDNNSKRSAAAAEPEHGRFVQANETLAAALAHMAAWTSEHSILDCGFGCGDQDLFWFAHCPLKEIVGVTLEQVQCNVAQARVQRAGLTSRIRLYCGSATALASIPDQTQSFDRVVALDCAYHFDTREQFLRQSYAALKPGGRIALADIILGPGCSRIGDAWALWLASHAVHMPAANQVYLDEYLKLFNDIGFVNVEFQVISGSVFPGLAAYLESHDRAFSDMLSFGMRVPLWMMARWLRRNAESRMLDFVLIAADKPS